MDSREKGIGREWSGKPNELKPLKVLTFEGGGNSPASPSPLSPNFLHSFSLISEKV
jgi:hypothetical protein